MFIVLDDQSRFDGLNEGGVLHFKSWAAGLPYYGRLMPPRMERFEDEDEEYKGIPCAWYLTTKCYLSSRMCRYLYLLSQALGEAVQVACPNAGAVWVDKRLAERRVVDRRTSRPLPKAPRILLLNS